MAGLITNRSDPASYRWRPGIGLEQPDCFAHQGTAPGDDAEAAAAPDVGGSEIERQQVQLAPVDDHQLAVIAGQVVRRARHNRSGFEQTQLQLSQALLACPIGVGDERMDGGVGERPLNFLLVATEDCNLDTALRAGNRFD